MKKVIFIAGPFRGDGTMEAKEKNVEVAKKFVKLFIENEIPYYSAHLNIDQELIDLNDEKAGKFSWDMNAEILPRCNALAALPGWEASSGTKQEIENAKRNSFPIFYLDKEGTIEEIKNWLKQND